MLTVAIAMKFVLSAAGRLIQNSIRNYAAYRQRRAAVIVLRHMDDRGLKDIGLYRSGIEEALRAAAACHPSESS